MIAPQTKYAYDAAGSTTSTSVLVRVSEWLTTTYGYDAWNRQTTVTAPEGDVTAYRYDTAGNLLSLTDASGNVTAYVYDALSRQVEAINENGDSRFYVYDSAGRLTRRTDRNGRVTEYSHDDLDRIKDEVWIENDANGDTTIASTYNGAGLLASIGDGYHTDTFVYDAGDRLTSRTRTGGGMTTPHTFGFTYTAGGQVDVVTQAVVGNADVVTDYDYDGAGDVKQITQSGASVVTKQVEYARSESGQVIGSKRFAGSHPLARIETTIGRDAIGRKTAITHRHAGVDLSGYTYTYDALSRTTAVDSLIDGLTSIGLDDNGRLTTADHAAIPDESFDYDATGNRIDADNVIGANNKLLDDGVFTYQYDDEGNRTGRIETATGVRTAYTYDFRNRLTWVRTYTAGGVLIDSAEYRYDTANQRIARAVDADGNGYADTIERFVVDGDTVTAVVNPQGDIDRQYFHGASVDEVLAEETIGGVVTWTLADGQGTIRDLARDVAGATAVVNHRVYDSFGNLHSQTNAAVDHLFGYTGRDFDEQTGMHYYRDRWMDPVTATFLSEDPIGFEGGDVNLVNYVGGAPYDYTDPTGNSWFSKALKKVKREAKRVVKQVSNFVGKAFDKIGNVLEEAWRDTREFIEDHPYISAGIALATGTFFVSAAGGFAGAAAKIGALASKAVGSISFGWTPASSGIGGTVSLNVGNFASLSAGAGISGTSVFASAGVSILGFPILGVGETAGVFGKVADPFASSLVGNFTDSVLQNTMPSNIASFQMTDRLIGGSKQTHAGLGGKGTGITDVGSFLQSVATDTAYSFAGGQFAQTGIPTALGVAYQTTQFAGDVYGAFAEVFAPPVQPVRFSAATSGATEIGPDGSVQQTGHVQNNPYVSTNGLQPVDGPVNLKSIYDREYQSRFDWINGPSFETIDLGISDFVDIDFSFTDDFWNNISSGVPTITYNGSTPDPTTGVYGTGLWGSFKSKVGESTRWLIGDEELAHASNGELFGGTLAFAAPVAVGTVLSGGTLLAGGSLLAAGGTALTYGSLAVSLPAATIGIGSVEDAFLDLGSVAINATLGKATGALRGSLLLADAGINLFQGARSSLAAGNAFSEGNYVGGSLNLVSAGLGFGSSALRNAEFNAEFRLLKPNAYQLGVTPQTLVAPKDVVPDVRTGAGYGVNDPPVRIQGEWSDNDLKAALLGHPPRGLESPDLHHAGQMPGSAVHEVLPLQHRGNKALHPNKRNQGVTAEMRKADRELHWWYRAQEEGARQRLPDWIYDD